MIETTALSKDRVLVLHLPDCHESLAGIIAGKIREYWYRPTIVFTGHGMLKGSGRSIETYHMYEQLNKHKDMLSKFGGHAMAAGMSIEEEKLDAFREAINRDCGLSDADLEEKVYADMVLSPGIFDIRTVEEFELLEPCGTKNPKPVFMAGHITLTRVRILGRNRNVMKFTAVDEKNNIIDLMRFGEEKELRDLLVGSGKEDELEQLYNGHGNVSIDIVYYPEINEWNGTRSLQHVIRDWRIR
jgi:single-stranded-DNA-specific exonuclease